ncbi:putative membrane protein YecN with MAPEG domain [Luteibacter jiangsuensis]|uniref:Membrane protein YecN with MAPEG domain n=1 Tax=Luteibacter jiangsuensis TaxID=637577 RepID=A0ABT9T1H5_9GAMM|nr:MAPEG family protein [Luteibacter jiangsuensis]MDQ0011126.1 putative membrane protein YecN with MAPEG domain [Luteibacter jiangsuensis]
MTSQLPAVVTLLTLLLMFATVWMVGRARERYGIKAPSISGDPAFERAWRVQMNTLENAVMFIPALWLAAQYVDPLWAGIAGLVWLAGRVWYALAYLRDPSRRGPGYMVSMIAWAVLMLMAASGIGMAIMENNAAPVEDAAGA